MPVPARRGVFSGGIAVAAIGAAGSRDQRIGGGFAGCTSARITGAADAWVLPPATRPSRGAGPRGIFPA
jgi:hypothetical protein